MARPCCIRCHAQPTANYTTILECPYRKRQADISKRARILIPCRRTREKSSKKRDVMAAQTARQRQQSLQRCVRAT
eukprot:364665-Chlamydomonas_euryale.AAC.4